MDQQQRIARALFLAALVFTLVMAWMPHPPSLPVKDKFQHMAAFVTLTVFACAAFPHVKLVDIGERLSFLGAIIEVVQSIPALNRDCDIFDWVADTVAVVGVLLVVLAYRSQVERSAYPERR